MSMNLCDFLLSVLGSLCAIGVLYLLYLASAWYAARAIATAECWWLPGAKTYRFVIRNIPRKSNLFGIRYRVWLRRILPPSEEISVETFLDSPLSDGERLLLPGGQDLPIVCFRLESSSTGLRLLVTDKMGIPTGKEEQIGEDVNRLMVEFSARARAWGLFKHEVVRIYAVPQYRDIEGKRCNMFRDYLLPIQYSHERKMKSVLEEAFEVTVTV